MADESKPKPGDIGWMDLTVPDAAGVRDFYAAVVGWKPEGVAMEGYEDFNMLHPETGRAMAGVCHAKGPNAGLPAAWMIYIVVADLKTSLDEVERRGGEVLRAPKVIGPQGGFGVIRDPGGAVCALYQPGGE